MLRILTCFYKVILRMGITSREEYGNTIGKCWIEQLGDENLDNMISILMLRLS